MFWLQYERAETIVKITWKHTYIFLKKVVYFHPLFILSFLPLLRHSLLFDYGLPNDGSDFPSDDADANLVPELVEKVALPILHHEIAHCWDMLSMRETKNAVTATSLVINYVSASSEALSDLLVAIRTCLADAVANLTV